MKKVSLIAILALASALAQAQLVTTTSRKISYEKTPSKTIWLARAGLTFANFGSIGSITGFNAGVEFQKTLPKNFYWGAGLGLKTKGFKEEYLYGSGKLNVTALEIPLNIGYKFDLGQDAQLDLHAGAFVNFDLFGKMGDVSLSDLDDYSRFDAGLALGAGIWYQRFNVNLNFQWGLVEQFKYLSDKENNIMLSLGYAF
jgi:NO-binding membrane sensor protein with MHYT domain